MPGMKDTKNMTETVYKKVSAFFRDQFGEDCGWAHSLLFASELSIFKEKTEQKKGKKSASDSAHVEETDIVLCEALQEIRHNATPKTKQQALTKRRKMYIQNNIKKE